MKETLLDNLRAGAEDVPMPQWHKDLLDEREQQVETGQAQFDDWDVAKTRIKKLTCEGLA